MDHQFLYHYIKDIRVAYQGIPSHTCGISKHPEPYIWHIEASQGIHLAYQSIPRHTCGIWKHPEAYMWHPVHGIRGTCMPQSSKAYLLAHRRHTLGIRMASVWHEYASRLPAYSRHQVIFRLGLNCFDQCCGLPVLQDGSIKLQ